MPDGQAELLNEAQAVGTAQPVRVRGQAGHEPVFVRPFRLTADTVPRYCLHTPTRAVPSLCVCISIVAEVTSYRRSPHTDGHLVPITPCDTCFKTLSTVHRSWKRTHFPQNHVRKCVFPARKRVVLSEYSPLTESRR